MTNNDIFRRIRFLFNYPDAKMQRIYNLTNFKTDESQIKNWLEREDEESFVEMKDLDLATFLDGLIIEKRGRREGELPKPEKVLNNNIILKKLKIALNLTSDEMLELLHSTDKEISKHELSAFFRNSNHNSYKPCLDQYLRNFLNALQQKRKF